MYASDLNVPRVLKTNKKVFGREKKTQVEGVYVYVFVVSLNHIFEHSTRD